MAETTESEALLRFLDALKQAAGCASQLAHHQQNPNWLTVRNVLENVRTTAANMAVSKPMPRQQVLANLDRRVKTIGNA